MAYRSDVEALEARYAAVQAELAERTRARDEVASLLEEARARERGEQLYADFASGGPQRRRRRRIRIALALAALTTAVLGVVAMFRVTHHEPDRIGPAFAAMERFTNEMCQCRDMACAQRISDEMMKWSQQEASHMREPFKLTDQQQRRAMAIGERMGKCMQTAMAVTETAVEDDPQYVRPQDRPQVAE